MVSGDGQAQRNYVNDSMTRTHHDIETMTRKLELEKRRLQRVEKELAAARRTYQIKVHGSDPSERSKSRGGSQSARDPPRQQESDALVPSGGSFPGAGGSTASAALSGPLRALLNRLDVQRKKLDNSNHENSELREEVNRIRKVRMQLNSIFDRLKAEIKQRSLQLADFVEETASSKALHGDAIQRVEVMKRHREVERKQFKQEVLRLREQLKLQDWERKEVEVQLKRADMGVQKKKELIIPEEETSFSESEMMRRIMKTAFLNCSQRRKIRQHQKSIEVFEQAFQTIKQSTGIEHIEEIVKIFVNLESRNFSLLTYVNVMNREVETLEGIRRERQQQDKAKHQADQRHEQVRHRALGDIQRQLEAASQATHDGQEALSQHQKLMEEMIPTVYEVGRLIEQEFQELLASGATLSAEEMLRLPSELREETLPEWLELIETGLGRFRELLPEGADKDGAFPHTALSSVKGLTAKRHGHSHHNPTLVKQQELPSALNLAMDEQGNPTQKRAHVQMTAAQKAELLDEESEEEDFEKGPLQLKDIRSRAEQSAARRKTRLREGQGKHYATSPTTGSLAVASARGTRLSSMDAASCEPGSPRSPARSSRGPRGEAPTEKEEEGLDDAASDGAAEKARGAGPGGSAHGSRRTSGMPTHEMLENDEGAPPATTPQKLGHGKVVYQAADSHGLAVSEEEVERCFLQRYKMTREELQVMADHMQIHIHNLCSLKQEFDQHDQDQSGYIDVRKLKGLLKKLGEDLTDEALDRAVKRLDSDGSGEIEFFEFTEWFTSTH